MLPIPIHPSNDEQLLKDVTDAVMEIVFEGDTLGGDERASFIESKLKALKDDARFTANCGDT